MPSQMLVEVATFTLFIVWLAFFDIGFLDGKERVKHSGDIFRLIVLPMFLALLGLAVLSTDLTLAFYNNLVKQEPGGSTLTPVNSLVDPVTLAILGAACLAIAFAYDIGYYVATLYVATLRRSVPRTETSRTATARRATATRSAQATPVASIAPAKVRSAFVGNDGRLRVVVE